MSVAPATSTWTYDDFTSAELDPDRWTIMVVPGRNGERHAYRDRNARVRTGDGRFELTIDPFSRFHDSDPVQNNAKQMYRSVRRFAVPEGVELRVEVDMAVRTYGQIPFDLLDAFGTVNVFDLETGVVFNIAATNDTVYAVVERLPIPGVVRPRDRYIHRVVLEVPTEPGQEHRYAIAYRAGTSRTSHMSHTDGTGDTDGTSETGGTSEAVWYVDDRRVYWARVPVPVRAFHVGMALFSARDLTRYSRAEREHGQGATGRWGPWRITASDQARG